MTLALASAETQTSLPQLRGGLLWAYRFAWIVLATACVAVLMLSLLDAAMHASIVALRIIKGGIVLAVALILLRRRQRDPVAALLCLAFLSWTISSSFDFTSTPQLPLLLDRLRFLLFALALLLFPDGNWRPAWTRKVAGASLAVLMLGVAETLQLVPTRLFLPLAIGCVLAAIGSLVARFRTAETEALRQQLRWVALGLVVGVGLILSARAGAALSVQSARSGELAILWEAMFQLGIVVIALGFLVSLLRYRLFDAETAISRSAAYAVLTIALVAIFAGTEALIERTGQVYLGMGLGDVSAAMAAAVAAVLLNPLHSRISNWAEQRFQRDLVTLKRDVPELVDHLAATSSSRRLAAAVLPRINEAIHATHSAFLVSRTVIAASGIRLKEAQRWASADDSAFFPIRFQLRCGASDGEAWLLLGPRPDGSLYGRDELDAVQSILPALRHALNSSMAAEHLRADIRRAHREIAILWSRLPTLDLKGQNGRPMSDLGKSGH